MQTILIVVHLFLAIGVVTLVLLQHGKGADAGAAFGSGASATVFGARGSASFLSRATAVLATLFFLTSMAMAYFASQAGKGEGLMDKVSPATEAPAAPAKGAKAPTAPAAPVPAPEVPGVPAAEAPAAVPAAKAPPPVPAAEAPAVATPGAQAKPAAKTPAEAPPAAKKE